MIVIGHRGAAGHAPENTLKSFEAALRLGAEWVELDVQLHQGDLLVFHDLRLERTTNGRGRLADHDLAGLRRLDAGQGERIPLLREVLDLVDARAGINVELKTADGTAAATAAVLQEALARGWPADKLLVSSFHLPELREFRRLLPAVPVGVLLAGVPLNLAAAATELKAEVVSLDREFADPALIEDAHRRGCRVYAYTVNDPAEFQRLRSQGVDGVFSDYPDRMLGK